jgi:hypothetical protein
MLFLWAHPVSYRTTRLAIAGLAITIWALALLLWWNVKPVRYLCLLFVVAVLILAIVPGRKADAAALRARYTQCLIAYEGTKYVWGGENRLGIDCSGLVRRGMIIALLKEGVATGNPGLIRESYFMRWFDCSANSLKDGYGNQTRQLFETPSIQKLDHSKLQLGDLAATADGVHILAYLGNERWIEADPGGRVLTLSASDENGWLKLPVVLLRWEILIEH